METDPQESKTSAEMLTSKMDMKSEKEVWESKFLFTCPLTFEWDVGSTIRKQVNDAMHSAAAKTGSIMLQVN
jgi:hypothetical protein